MTAKGKVVKGVYIATEEYILKKAKKFAREKGLLEGSELYDSYVREFSKYWLDTEKYYTQVGWSKLNWWELEKKSAQVADWYYKHPKRVRYMEYIIYAILAILGISLFAVIGPMGICIGIWLVSFVFYEFTHH